MIKKILRHLCTRETGLYLLFGVLTTLVNYVVFWLILHFFGAESTLVANAIAFLAAVTFAYITNKLLVFESRSWAWSVLRREIPSFLGARLLSFGMEELGLLICLQIGADRLSLFGISGILIAKVILSFLVILLNYLFSKLFIFRKK